MQAIQEALGFSPLAFVLEIVVFVFLLVFMNAFFWKPIMGHMAERDKAKSDAYKKVQTTEQEMEALRTDYLARITQIEAEARAHIQAAIKEAQTERERIIAEAREQSDATLRQGIADMQREKISSLQSLRGRMVGLASNAAVLALGSAGDANALRQTIETRIAQNTPTA